MRLSYYADLSQCNLTTANRNGLTLSFPSILVSTLGPADPPAISKTVAPMNMKFCRILETPLIAIEMLQLCT